MGGCLLAGRFGAQNGEVMDLTDAQRAALECVASSARARREQAAAELRNICQMCDIEGEVLAQALANVRRDARVGLHFHPDRPCTEGQSVVQCLLEQGVYKSQFETGISNGGLTAYAGGRRDTCEQQLFGGAYHEGVPDSERPKYGSLELLRHAEGPSPRFGSCYFLLAKEVSLRCTFTYGDSHDDPRQRGTHAEFDDVFAGFLLDVFYHECALGEQGLRVPAVLQRLHGDLAAPLDAPAISRPVRNLNQYLEAQVHGALLLDRDVAALVVDPAFRGTETGRLLSELGERYRIPVFAHHGFRLAAADVPRDFRGPGMPALARRIALSGFVDASRIAAAVVDVHQHPAAWRSRGSLEQVLQELKLLWHVLVKYGAPVPEQSRAEDRTCLTPWC